MHGRLSVKMEYFRRYLQTHGEPDGFPRLENDLVFYLEVQKFKVRNMVSWLVRSSLDRAVRVRAPAGDIVSCSWARHDSVSLHPVAQMGTGELNAGSNPAMD